MLVVFTWGLVGKERTIVSARNAGHLAVRKRDTTREGAREARRIQSTERRPDALQHSLGIALNIFCFPRRGSSFRTLNSDGVTPNQMHGLLHSSTPVNAHAGFLYTQLHNRSMFARRNISPALIPRGCTEALLLLSLPPRNSTCRTS